MDYIQESKQDRASTGATIPRAGFLNKIRKYVERVEGSGNYGRFLLQGFIFILFKSMPTVLGSLIRGEIYRVLLGSLGHGTLIEKNVVLNIPKNIFLGSRVVLGESSVIDPRGIHGKITIRDDVHIQRWCRLTTGGTKEVPGELTIHDYVYVGPYSYIHAGGKVGIGNSCLFGPGITIVAGNHNYRDKTVLIRYQGGVPKDISIGEDVWLSANVTVLGGVSIGNGSVIGAGSVVTRDIPPYSIAVGAPAKVIGTRE